MGSDDRRRAREQMLSHLRLKLEEIEPIGLSLWLGFPTVIVIFFGTLLLNIGKLLLTTALALITFRVGYLLTLPFRLFIFLDCVVITAWYLKKMAYKMNGAPK